MAGRGLNWAGGRYRLPAPYAGWAHVVIAERTATLGKRTGALGGGQNEPSAPEGRLVTTSEASKWASDRVGYKVTPSNITYLVNYGLVPRAGENGRGLKVRLDDLERYYESRNGRRESAYKSELGSDLNWRLSFEEHKEAETTKHVHRLHPYKGKFIPQLVEYFIDPHVDEFKTEVCFRPGDIILDPFCGSGTTLVQANELGMHAVGVDVSLFNSMISNLKLADVDLEDLENAIYTIENCIASDLSGRRAREFEEDLLEALKEFNCAYFPRKEFRYQVRTGQIDEDAYASAKAVLFRPVYEALLEKHGVSNTISVCNDAFMDNWYLDSVRSEIESAKRYIEDHRDPLVRDMLRLILSRAVRSSRATTHSDLATLVRPVTETYYCAKHSQVCKPLFSMLGWWRRYAKDTIKRLAEFERLRTSTRQVCLVGDSREIDLFGGLKAADRQFGALARERKIQGIFSSPPYVGMIDYHEQHAYAYELFGLPRNDEAEIGPMRSGKSRQAQASYVDGIAGVLRNCQRFMADDCDVFLVANDKFGLYPRIAEMSEMKIVKEYKRPVLNRAEGDKGAYCESIFHMRRKRLL